MDRKANNYDGIQGNDDTQASRPRQVDRNDSTSTTITPHIDRYPTCIYVLSSWKNRVTP